MAHLSRRKSLKAILTIPMGLSGCIGSNNEPDIHIFNSTSSTVSVQIEVSKVNTNKTIFSDTVSVSPDGHHIYKDPIPEGTECMILVETEGGLETEYKWKSDYGLGHSVQFDVKESEIETNHGTA
ncbi:hypothetical protein SAMN05216559_0140 [Halomicrobium zhouii]|uniref:Uncharacterized protein n=1 Tax=Halomicrobium zhouii TaxID=767519 RepID=A0A1I6K3J1_9EURY|nr:hypothetical protein SAMN05216559_0140 [Halomicrobium zhouii]